MNSSSSSSTSRDKAEPQSDLPQGELDRTQLLEALCHSQTRARKAENAAMQAKVETESVARLFLKQASELFAYKQWFQLLQYESLILEMKSNDQPKRSRSSHDIDQYIMAFAFGLGLIGAGMIVGWTVGWMLPSCSTLTEIRP